jgi:hypothetical protein
VTLYRSKPFEIEATQWFVAGDHPYVQESPSGGYYVAGRQGRSNVDPGDYIIAEPDGSGFYPCKPDVFAAKYEPK